MVRWLTLCFGLVVLSACSGPRDTSRPGADVKGLPSLSYLNALPRTISATSRQTGSQFITSGGPVGVAGETAVFAPSAGQLAYAIYEFSLEDTVALHSASYAFTALAPHSSVWFALSDYERGSWRLLEASELTDSFEFEDAAGTFSSNGSCYVAVISFGTALTVGSIELDFAGPLWEHSFGIAGMSGHVYETDVTEHGVYLATAFFDSGADSVRSVLVHYSLAGQLLTSVETPRNHSPRAFAVAPDGSVYYALRLDNGFEQMLLKLDSELSVVWARKYTMTDSYVYFDAITVDPSTGDALIVGDGYTTQPTGGPKLLLRVSAEGDLMWQRGSDPTFHLWLPDLEVDLNTGEIHAAGTWGMFAPDWVVFHWDSDGALLQYTQLANPVPNKEASFLDTAMVWDAAGNLYLTASDQASWQASSFLLRFDPAGVLAQAVRISGFGTELSGVGLDSMGNVRITGYPGQAQVFAPDFTYRHTLANAPSHLHDFAGTTVVVSGGAARGQWPARSPGTITLSDCKDELEFVDYKPNFSDMSGVLTDSSITLEPVDGLVLDEFGQFDIRVGRAYLNVY